MVSNERRDEDEDDNYDDSFTPQIYARRSLLSDCGAVRYLPMGCRSIFTYGRPQRRWCQMSVAHKSMGSNDHDDDDDDDDVDDDDDDDDDD